MRARVVQCGTRQGSGPQDPPHKRMPQQAAKPANGTRTAKAAKRPQNRENQLKNVFELCYLGHLFQADGDPFHALEVRAAQAKAAFGQLHEFWSSNILTKTRSFAIDYTMCSVVTDHLRRKLTEKTCRFLAN